MPVTVNRARADALCAIIALGFAEQNRRASTGEVLYLIASDDDVAPHSDLNERLRDKFGFTLPIQMQNAKDDEGYKIHPFIYSLLYSDPRHPRALNYQQAKLSERNYQQITQLLETAASSVLRPDNRFYGGYIGGLIDYNGDNICLIGPSSLYVRDTNYLDYEGDGAAQQQHRDKVCSMFMQSNDVTKGIKRFLLENVPYLDTGEAVRNRITIIPQLTNGLILEGQGGDDNRILDGGATFASCHGLITSMFHFRNAAERFHDDCACVEFSLSDDTCKSASCVPCALFAASQGAPASAVHFGRGDFWNLPHPDIRARYARGAEMERNWREYIKACFIAGSRLILESGQAFAQVTRDVANWSNNAANVNLVPDAFLDALTFDGAFVGKMLTAL